MRLFTIASSPFFTSDNKTSQLMLMVCCAMLPGIWAQWFYFGWGNSIQILLALAVALSAEAAILWLRKRPIKHSLSDNSAMVTAMLLGAAIPGYAPWWLIVIGTLFAIIVAKQLYGGLGQNLFNPAMIGYVVLLISFPLQMTSWNAPATQALALPDLYQALSIIFTGAATGIDNLPLTLDGITMATPLDAIRTQLTQGHAITETLNAASFSALAGEGWQWLNIGFLVGGLFLLSKRVISFHLCASFLVTLTLCSLLGYLIDPEYYLSPQMHLLSGGTMLGAFFIVTDPVTAATSNRGRIYYGALIALLVYIVRTWGNYPDAIAFSVLLANLAAPFIDNLSQPRTYGHQLDKVKSNSAIKQQQQARSDNEQ